MTPLLITVTLEKSQKSHSSFHAVLLKKKMKMELNVSDIDVILTSLKYSKNRISEYPYPEINPGDACKLRTKRLDEIVEVEIKLRDMKKEKRNGLVRKVL